MFKKNENVVLQTKRKGVLTGKVLEIGDDGMLLLAFNGEVIFLPGKNINGMNPGVTGAV